jgi:hypothetical protein
VAAKNERTLMVLMHGREDEEEWEAVQVRLVLTRGEQVEDALSFDGQVRSLDEFIDGVETMLLDVALDGDHVERFRGRAADA